MKAIYILIQKNKNYINPSELSSFNKTNSKYSFQNNTEKTYNINKIKSNDSYNDIYRDK